MRRKVLILDLVLVAVVVAAGVQFRREWQDNKARERARIGIPVKPVQVPPLQPIAKQPDVVPSNYFTIAEKLLFDRSRNSVVEPPPKPAPPPPPPPKPMPPLPVYHGMMNIGKAGPVAILSVNNGSPHTAVHPGEQIGQFTLVDVNSNGITLEWEGQRIYKDADELSNRASTANQETVADSRPPAPQPGAPPPAPPLTGPGDTTSFGNRICQLNDGHNEGEIVDGYRKVIHTTPFGKSCTYDRAQ